MVSKVICNLQLKKSHSTKHLMSRVCSHVLFLPQSAYALGGITHLSWVSVITGLQQHQASFLAGAALSYQTFVGLQMVELQKKQNKTVFLRTSMQTSWYLGDVCLEWKCYSIVPNKNPGAKRKPGNKARNGDLGL